METFNSPCLLEKQIAFIFWPLGVRELIVNETHSYSEQVSVVIAASDEWHFHKLCHLVEFWKCWDGATKDFPQCSK